MTAEELLATMTEPLAEDDGYCTIDPETRVITIPPEYQLLGVESDEKAERLYFQCPKIVGDNIDLSTLGLRINFQNANMQKDQYIVDDVQVSGDMITFSWLLSRRVTQYRGGVSFIVCAVKTSGEAITNEWNTTLATAQVLEGLEVDTELPEEETDVVNQLIAIATQRLTDVQNATSAANTAASNANQKAQEAVNATEDARSVIEQITKDSYLHTALETFINEVTATPTAYGNALVEKIEGYIRQNQSKGYQLFDASKLASKTQDGVAVTNNGDGSFTVSGNGNLSEICSTSYDDANIAQKLKAGKIRLKTESNPYPYFYVQFRTSAGENVAVVSTNSKEKDITSDDLTKITSVRFGFYGDPSQTIVPGTIKPMLYQDGDGTWEPYTGGEPAPNPDYPQVIHGVGDMGFFDGELLQGGRKTADGSYLNNSYCVCNANFIPCKQGDSVKVHYLTGIEYIGLLWYKKDGTFISGSVNSSKNVLEFSANAPAESAYVCFNIQTESTKTLTPQSAKHITVTINGMYAICVKMVGKNLCSGIKMGAWLYNSGKYSADRYYFCCENLIPVKPNTTYIVKNFSSALKCNGFCFYTKDRQYISADGDGIAKTTTPENCYFLTFNLWNREETYTLTDVQNVQLEEGESTTDFVPYQGNTTYIPISSPLFEGDYLFKRNMEHKIYRKIGFAVFDGSEDELWADYQYQESYNGVYIELKNMKNGLRQKFFNSHFKNIELENITGTWFGVNDQNMYIFFGNSGIATDYVTFKQWLKTNNMYIVYELETPIEEEITPEAQKALYSIMATDEQTELTIVGVPADAEIQNQFLLPRNEDGALNTTAYCTAEKNKIVLNELVAQNLDARVNKLEIDNATLAEQTIIVE